MADPEIFISGGPLTDLRVGPLESGFSDSLYKQPIFSPKGGGGPGPLGPPKSASGNYTVVSDNLTRLGAMFSLSHIVNINIT